MKRQPYPWTVTDRDGQVLDQGERFAHNAAVAAGLSALRAIACAERQTYGNAVVERSASETSMRWYGTRTGRELVITVRRPTS